MKIMKLFDTRLAIRNLIIVTVLSLAYLFGKHLQAIYHTPGYESFKIAYAKHK
jgi:hypothetical protein